MTFLAVQAGQPIALVLIEMQYRVAASGRKPPLGKAAVGQKESAGCVYETGSDSPRLAVFPLRSMHRVTSTNLCATSCGVADTTSPMNPRPGLCSLFEGEPQGVIDTVMEIHSLAGTRILSAFPRSLFPANPYVRASAAGCVRSSLSLSTLSGIQVASRS